MSLINEMLKDLDKRGGDPAGSSKRNGIRAVPDIARQRSPWRWIAGLLLLVTCGAVVWMLWDTPALPVQQSAAPAPVPVAPVAPGATTTPAPVAAAPAVPELAPVVNEPPKAVPQPATVLRSTGEQKSQLVALAKPERAPLPPAPAAEGAMKLALSGALASIAAPEAKAATAARGRRGTGTTATEPARMSKETTSQQQAENAYGRAIAQLESGNKAEAMATLEGVLAQNPRHASARQALVGLLLDAKRSGDAVRVLTDGLQFDTSQTGMAMILARLQVEKGDTRAAIATLQQSLPHATHKSDYQAFLAALYQREKRHREAITHYQQALRNAPDNGVWWMGYGISLQAEGRIADARTAYSHARDTERLSPSLRAFVEQRLSQLQ